MVNKLRISLGSDNFRELVTTSDVFVDKTLFIKEVLDSGEKAMLITRPRRWGKSLALDMLKTFLDINHDTESISVEKTPSEKSLFSGPNKTIKENINKQLFTSLNIAQEKDRNNKSYIEQYLGQYPVIHISLKDVTGNTLGEVENKLRMVIRSTFEQHNYLLTALDSVCKDRQSTLAQKDKAENQIKAFRKISQDSAKNADAVEIKESLKFLSQLLYEHHKQKVYILVDEYDKPSNYLLEKNLSTNVQEIASFITDILSTCGKSNDYLEKIILTGIFDSLKKEGGSGFNNVVVYGITGKKFSQHFGFSFEEVKKLVEKLTFKAPEEILQNIKNWYNGYSVPMHGNKHIQVYTPWAVMRYLNSAYKDEETMPQNYWVQSGASTIFQTLLKNEDCAGSSFINSLLNITQIGNVTLEYDTAMSLFRCNLNTANQDESIFSYLLLNSGYLTALNQNYTHITLSIPNFEVKEELKTVFNKHIKNIRHNKNDICTKIQNAFNQEKPKDPIFLFVKAVRAKDMGSLENVLTKINCNSQKYTIHPLNLAALSGNVEIFKATVAHCKQSTVQQNFNLTTTDYAYISANTELVYAVQREYGSKVSVSLPNLNPLDKSMCSINELTNLAIGTISATGIGTIVGKLAGFSIPAIIQAHPFLTATTLLAVSAPFVYSKLYYSHICENYNLYTKMENVTSQHSKSLDQFLKYRLHHNDTSYVKVGESCHGNDQKVSLFTTDLVVDPDLPGTEQLNIVLCNGQVLIEAESHLNH